MTRVVSFLLPAKRGGPEQFTPFLADELIRNMKPYSGKSGCGTSKLAKSAQLRLSCRCISVLVVGEPFAVSIFHGMVVQTQLTNLSTMFFILCMHQFERKKKRPRSVNARRQRQWVLGWQETSP